jgi:hypothetical protein
LHLTRSFERSKERVVLSGTRRQYSIDEVRRGTLQAAAFATLPLFLDAGKMALFQHITCVLLHLETKKLGEAGHIRIPKSIPVLEQEIMHLPALSLSRCGLRRPSRMQRVGVNLAYEEQQNGNLH